MSKSLLFLCAAAGFAALWLAPSISAAPQSASCAYADGTVTATGLSPSANVREMDVIDTSTGDVLQSWTFSTSTGDVSFAVGSFSTSVEFDFLKTKVTCTN